MSNIMTLPGPKTANKKNISAHKIEKSSNKREKIESLLVCVYERERKRKREIERWRQREREKERDRKRKGKERNTTKDKGKKE